jgi:hypothetical protein
LALLLLIGCGAREQAAPLGPEQLGARKAEAKVGASALPAFPLRVSSNKRYLEDQQSRPFPIFGDSGWEASHNLTPTEQTRYLDDRMSRGFTAVFQQAIDAKFTVNRPPRDIVGNLPFTKRVDGATYAGSPNGNTTQSGLGSVHYPPDPYSNIQVQAPDFTTPNEAYFARLDAYLALCASKGIVVLLWPAYVGYGGVDQGFMPEMVVNDAVIGVGGFAGKPFANATKSKLWNYGAFLASRYKTFGNIVWVHGGDYGDQAGNGGVFTPAQKAAVNSLFAGLKSVAAQSSTLHTGHWSRRSLATDIAFTAGALDLEAVYANTASAEWARRGYVHTPVAPTFMLEGHYEFGSIGGSPNRRFQWWAMLGCTAGYFYGSEKVWPFVPGWDSFLGTEGARDMAHLNGFFRSLNWHNLVPSGLDGMRTLVTAGGGTAVPQSEDYVAAAATRDGTTLVAYVPPAHTGAITVDMRALVGQAHARWFNPSSGRYTEIGSSLPTNVQRAFTPPADNGSGFDDWVLLIDACSVCSPSTGVPLPRAAALGLGFLLLGVAVLAARLRMQRLKQRIDHENRSIQRAVHSDASERPNLRMHAFEVGNKRHE